MLNRILIVDDDIALNQSMHEFLAMVDFIVCAVSNAEKALDFLKKENFDVVITDIRMPGMDGLELTELIKKDYDSDVIIMTGYSDEHSYENAINKGASDIVFKPVRFKELLLRLKRVLRERELKRERFEMLEKLNKLAITDDLTKLYNSRYFYNQIDLEIDRFNRYSHSLSLLLFDIDYFKEYNDKYGHLQGDKVLAKIGSLTKSCLRKMDTACRYGGEEFTVILPEINCQEAEHVAKRIRAAVEEEVFSPVPGSTVTITISVGVTEHNADEEISKFVQRADKAMYEAKRKGRNRIYSIPS
jgi:diguanylate cyclase (GGDEF)-like protein